MRDCIALERRRRDGARDPCERRMVAAARAPAAESAATAAATLAKQRRGVQAASSGPHGHCRTTRLPPAPDGHDEFWVVDHPSYHDGSCFYHALATLGGGVASAAQMRQRVHRQLHLDGAPPAVRARSANPRHWAETEEVIAAARCTHRRLCVFETANQMWIEFGDDGPRYHLLNTDNRHFAALMPARPG